MKLPFKSLQSRIIFLFVTLILAVQFMSFIAIWVSINKNARVAIKEQLGIGEKVLRTVIIRRGENLTLSARILATDYGFRQAIASNDSETIQSALENSGSRIESDVNMLYSPEGARQVVSGSLPINLIDEPIHQLIETAQSGGESFKIAVFEGVPYLLVAVPVKAPLTIAWIITGFEIDDNWANRIQDVSLLEVSFITKNNRNSAGKAQWNLSSSTMNRALAQESISGIPNSWSQASDKNTTPSNVLDTEVSVQGLDYGTRYVQLLNQDNQVLIAVLQRSITESLAPYFSLQLNLLVLTLSIYHRSSMCAIQ